MRLRYAKDMEPVRSMRLAKLCSIGLVALFAVCCNRDVPHLHEAEAPKLDSGWTALKSDDGSVTVGMPESFHNALDKPQSDLPNLTPDPASVPPPDPNAGGDPSTAPNGTPDPQQQAAVNRFVGDMNSMSAAMEENLRQQTIAEMQKKGYVVWAWLNGKPTLGEDRTQFAVKKIPNAGVTSLDDAALQAKLGMGGDVKKENVTLPIGPAVKLSSDYQDRIGDQRTEIQYVLLDNGDEYILKFFALNGPEQIQPIADSVANTLRIKPKR